MASKGPLVRVNTERDIIIKMTKKHADEFIATHPGAKIVPTPNATEYASTFAEPDPVDAQSVPVAGETKTTTKK